MTAEVPKPHEQTPKHLRLLRPFVLLGLLAGSAGTALGVVLLEATQWFHTGSPFPWKQVHAQLQIFGFLVPLVTGFAIYLVPRLAGGHPIESRRVARTALAAQSLGILLVLIAAGVPSASEALRRAAALMVLLGTGAATVALRQPIAHHAQAVGGRSRVGYLWLLESALWSLALAGLCDAAALWLGGRGPFDFLEQRAAAAAYRLGIEGFAVGMSFGVSARMLTGFLGIDPSRAYPSSTSAYARNRRDIWRFWFSLVTWVASVVVGAIGELLSNATVTHVANLLFAVGAVSFALRLGLAPLKKGLAIDRSQDPFFAYGARAVYALLVLGALIGAGAAIFSLAGFSVAPMWADARRHAVTIGFLLGLIALMSGRLAPGFAGRKVFAPGLRVGAVILFTTSGVLRACEGVAAQWALPSWLIVSGVSGVLALLGFCALLGSAGGTLIAARIRH